MQEEAPQRSTSETQGKDGNQYDHRFQRTDQWMPVYSWLESLNTEEVVKSKDISDWLSANPQILEQLSSRHSRYHLLHYIKKCHVKLLKRRERLKVELHSSKYLGPLQFQEVLDICAMKSKPFVDIVPRENVKMRPKVAVKASAIKIDKTVEAKLPVPGQYVGNNLSSIPKDSDLYKAKQIEAIQKYEILVEFEKQLLSLFPDT